MSSENQENSSPLSVSAIVSFVSNSFKNKECNEINGPLADHLKCVYSTLYWGLLAVANGAFIMDPNWPLLFLIIWLSSSFLMSKWSTDNWVELIVFNFSWNLILALIGLILKCLLMEITLIEASIMCHLFLCIASMYFSFRVSVRVGHAGLMYFLGTLLTMLISGFVVPIMIDLIYIMTRQRSYTVHTFQSFVLLGMLVLCGLTMRETSVIIKNYRLKGKQNISIVVGKMIVNYFDFFKPFFRDFKWGIKMFEQSVKSSHCHFMNTIYEPYLKPLFTSTKATVDRVLMILYQLFCYIRMMFKNLIYDPLIIPMIGHIGWCLEQAYHVNLSNLGVYIVYTCILLYIFNNVYGYFK